MTFLITQTVRDKLLSLYPEGARPLVEAALPELELQAARLAMEALDVERSEIPFAEAVHRPGEWPLMARVHHGLLDILQLELSEDLQEILLSVLANVEQWDGLEGLRQLITCRAAVNGNGMENALARFALYEAIRLNLWVLCWESPETEALGCMKQFDRDAEVRLRDRLTQSELFDDDVRPLHVLVADAALHLLERFEAIRDEMAVAAPEIVEFIDGIVDAARIARELNAADAAVLRNEYADHLDGTKLESVLLSEQHPLVLPSPGAIDTRRSRLPEKLSGARRRPGRRLVDILRER